MSRLSDVRRRLLIAATKQTVKIVPWATGTDAEITDMIQAANNGLITLSDHWNIGDTRTIQLSSMSEDTERGVEAHAAQTIELVLMDSTCTGFSINGVKPNMIVGLKNALVEPGSMNITATNDGGWRDSMRRYWCNNDFRNALPSAVRGWFRQFTWSTGSGDNDVYPNVVFQTQDYFGFATEKSVSGYMLMSRSAEASLYSQWNWYIASENRNKKNGQDGSVVSWWNSSTHVGTLGAFCNVDTSGSPLASRANSLNYLSPFGCI